MFIRRIRVVALGLGVLLVVSANVVPAITVGDIDARLSGIASSYADGDIVKDRLQRIYSNTRDLLRTTRQHEAAAKQFESAMTRGSQSLVELQTELASIERQGGAAKAAKTSRPVSIEIAERDYRMAQSRLALLADKLSDIVDQERILMERPGQLRAIRETLTIRISELEAATSVTTETPG